MKQVNKRSATSDMCTPKRQRHSGDKSAEQQKLTDAKRQTLPNGNFKDQGFSKVCKDGLSEKNNPDLNPKVFNDPIHGHIELHPLLVKIIDTPQFQRLRNIKQLGGCYFVFPGAAHNRFEHSIGVGYLAGKFLKSIQKRQPELDMTDVDILCVEIAGLCHDLGHGPFSHAFDNLFIPKARPGHKWKHENASLAMFDHLVEQNGLLKIFIEFNITEKDLLFIKELIAGPLEQNDEEWQYKGRMKDKCYMYEVVANKKTGIDVDKWDYFARDCHNLGIQNNFDHKRYMKFTRVIEVDGRRQICIRDKENNNMYDMFHTRNCLHRRAYQHKTSNIVEIMIVEAMLQANDHIFLEGKDGEKKRISEAIDDMFAYTKLTDNIFEQILLSTSQELEEARTILTAIQRRQLYKCVGQTIIENNKKFKQDQEEEVAKEIADKCIQEDGSEITGSDLIVHFVNFDYGMKEKNPIDQLRFYAKNKPNEAMKFRKNQISNLLPENFAEQQMRVYCKKTDPLSLKTAESGFFRWCEGKQCTTPKVGHGVPELTPMKPYSEDRKDDVGSSPSCVSKLDFSERDP